MFRSHWFGARRRNPAAQAGRPRPGKASGNLAGYYTEGPVEASEISAGCEFWRCWLDQRGEAQGARIGELPQKKRALQVGGPERGTEDREG
jgi:hypothetical protein